MSGMTMSNASEVRSLAGQAFPLAQELLSDILLQITSLAPFDPNDEKNWNLQLSALTHDIGQFVEVTTVLSKLMLLEKHSIQPIKDSHIHMLFVLKGIAQAQQKLDQVILEDLIKHELKDNLTQWKIDLIPNIKKLLNA